MELGEYAIVRKPKAGLKGSGESHGATKESVSQVKSLIIVLENLMVNSLEMGHGVGMRREIHSVQPHLV